MNASVEPRWPARHISNAWRWPQRKHVRRTNRPAGRTARATGHHKRTIFVATQTLQPDVESVNVGCRASPEDTSDSILWQHPRLWQDPLRAQCPECSHRFRWPEGAPWTALEPFERPEVVCSKCLRVIALQEEPCDDKWWVWMTAPMAPQAQPQRPSPVRSPQPIETGSARHTVVHRPSSRRGMGGVRV